MWFYNILLLCSVVSCSTYNILAIFPHDGRSHHIFFSPLIEELAKKDHNVTVINYHPIRKVPKLRQISLKDSEVSASHIVDIERQLKLMYSDLLLACDAAESFKHIANTNCKKLMTNPEVQELMQWTGLYDVVIVEQFVSDCGLAIAYKLGAPTVGMTTHVLMPWTYSRLGAPNNPAFVPNRRFASGTTPNLFNRIKSALVNFILNMYFTYNIQKNDQRIVNYYYPEIPSLEELGKNMSLILLNQYFPLTGPRLYGPNVVEIGGMHVDQHEQIEDKDLQRFLDTSHTEVVYISFGTVAANFPHKILDEIKEIIRTSNMKFVWKTDLSGWSPPQNAFLAKWVPQVAVLCHPKVVAFVTHAGMLSTSEAVYCGVPIVGVPLVGDQFANCASAVENGLGVTVDITTFKRQVLDEALKTVLQDEYQKRAKKLSQLWKDRPLSPMDTAIFWIEYVARNKRAANLRPPTVDLPFYTYLNLDIFLVCSIISILCIYGTIKVFFFIINLFEIIVRVSKVKSKSA